MSKIAIAIYLIVYVAYILITLLGKFVSVMYKKAHLESDFRKKKSPRLGLEPTKWDKKWVSAWKSFSERERRVKLALLSFRYKFAFEIGFRWDLQ